MKNLLVAVEFTENEMHLLDEAIQMARAFGAKLWLLHIAAPDPDFVGYEAGPQHERDGRASELRGEHKRLQQYADKLRAQGVEADSLLVQGATVEMIIEESKKLDVDLIIAGHHERGFLYNWLVESAATKVMRKSKIPVMIIPI